MNAIPIPNFPIRARRVLTPRERLQRADTERLNATVMASAPNQNHKMTTKYTNSMLTPSGTCDPDQNHMIKDLAEVLSSIQSTVSISRNGKVRKRPHKPTSLRTLRSKVPPNMSSRLEKLDKPFQDNEPLRLGQRVILRTHFAVPVQKLAVLHVMYQKYEVRANKILNIMMRGEPTTVFNTALRCAIREVFEERLKSTAQLCELFPTNPNLTVQAQEVLEEFYQVHRIPNNDDRIFLGRVLSIDAELLDAWIAMKSFRLRGHRAVSRIFVKRLDRGYRQWLSHREDLDLDSQVSPERYDPSQPGTEKPYTRH